MAFRPRGYLSPNSRLYAACFLRAHSPICTLLTTRNRPAARTNQVSQPPSFCSWSKGRTSEGAADATHYGPREDLEEVVGAREMEGRGEAVARGHGARRRPRRAERAQGQVRAQVGELGELGRSL